MSGQAQAESVTAAQYTKEMLFLEPYAQRAIKTIMFSGTPSALQRSIYFTIFLNGEADTWQYKAFQTVWIHDSAMTQHGFEREPRAGGAMCAKIDGTSRLLINSEAAWEKLPAPLRVIVADLQNMPTGQAVTQLPPELRAVVQKLQNEHHTGGSRGARELAKLAANGHPPIGSLALAVDQDLDHLVHCNVHSFSEHAIRHLRAFVASLCSIAGIAPPGANVALDPWSQQPMTRYFAMWRAFTIAVFAACRKSQKVLRYHAKCKFDKPGDPLAILVDGTTEKFSTQDERIAVLDEFGETCVDAMRVVNALRLSCPAIYIDQCGTDCARHGGRIDTATMEQLSIVLNGQLNAIRTYLG